MATQGAGRTVAKVLAIQLVVTLTIAVVSLGVGGLKEAYSALVGGGINVLATAYFARRVFAARPGTPAKGMVRAFYVAETVKILLTGAMFAVAIIWLDLAYLPLFLTYAVTMLAFWIALPLTL